MARAKFNVRLEVGTTRPDGYHAVRSVIADLSVGDEMEFRPAAAFSVECDDPAIAPDTNLACVAALNLSVDLPALAIFIKKRLPRQAGLGGGSADAAAALRGIARALAETGRPIDDAMLLAAAVKTGADIAACLCPGFKLVEGRGEIVRPVALAPPPWGVLLLKPSVGVATKTGYRLLDESRSGSTTDIARGDGGDEIARLIDALSRHDFATASALVHNDFQAPIEAAYPEIADARRRMAAAGAAATLLCGSGSCVAGLFESVDAAFAAAPRLSPADDEWSCATGFHR